MTFCDMTAGMGKNGSVAYERTDPQKSEIVISVDYETITLHSVL